MASAGSPKASLEPAWPAEIKKLQWRKCRGSREAQRVPDGLSMACQARKREKCKLAAAPCASLIYVGIEKAIRAVLAPLI